MKDDAQHFDGHRRELVQRTVAGRAAGHADFTDGGGAGARRDGEEQPDVDAVPVDKAARLDRGPGVCNFPRQWLAEMSERREQQRERGPGGEFGDATTLTGTTPVRPLVG